MYVWPEDKGMSCFRNVVFLSSEYQMTVRGQETTVPSAICYHQNFTELVNNEHLGYPKHRREFVSSIHLLNPLSSQISVFVKLSHFWYSVRCILPFVHVFHILVNK
jgi:hypothetical protein